LKGTQTSQKKANREGRARKLSKSSTQQIVNSGPQTTYIKKIQKKAAQLADLMTEQDLIDDLRVCRDAKNAKFGVFNRNTGVMEFFEDHKTRLAATQFSRAYAEGLPVARQIQIRAEFESMDDTLERLKNSPEAMAAIAGLKKAGLELAIEGEVIEVESDVQESPGQNGEEVTESDPPS
jgi:hypothetical protein